MIVISLSLLAKIVIGIFITFWYYMMIVAGVEKSDSVQEFIAGSAIFTIIFSFIYLCLYWA